MGWTNIALENILALSRSGEIVRCVNLTRTFPGALFEFSMISNARE